MRHFNVPNCIQMSTMNGLPSLVFLCNTCDDFHKEIRQCMVCRTTYCDKCYSKNVFYHFLPNTTMPVAKCSQCHSRDQIQEVSPESFSHSLHHHATSVGRHRNKSHLTVKVCTFCTKDIVQMKPLVLFANGCEMTAHAACAKEYVSQ
jgi:hypothetical protein